MARYFAVGVPILGIHSKRPRFTVKHGIAPFSSRRFSLSLACHQNDDKHVIRVLKSSSLAMTPLSEASGACTDRNSFPCSGTPFFDPFETVCRSSEHAYRDSNWSLSMG